MRLVDIKNNHLSNLNLILKDSKKLDKITIFDLIEENKNPLIPGVGVYIFHNKKGQVFYVGKCSSRCFAERIPSHFDLRKDGWFNTLLKKLCSSEMNYASTLYKAALYAKEHLYLTLIHVNSNDKEINKGNCTLLEKLLRIELQPCLNSYSFKTQNKFKIIINNNKTIISAMKALKNA